MIASCSLMEVVEVVEMMEVMEVMAVVVASQVQSVGGRERFMQDNTLNSG